MTTANCPSCGAQVEFTIGSSSVVVCNYCRTLVARTDRGIEDDGKVAAIIDTGSPLRVGVSGKYRGNGFRLTGHTQMRHQAGGVWDEWYAAFNDGRWGWIAEAQGRFYVTFRTADATVPSFESLQLGAPVPQVDNMVVAELGTATLAGAEGELPWRPHPGDTYDYADLSGHDPHFATIDYSEDAPIVFKGAQVALEDLGIEAGLRPKQTRVAVTKLSCSNCGAALELRAPDQAERIYCPSCGAGHDISEGKLKYIAAATKKKIEPRIPLGKTGTVDGVPYVVAGFMQRSVTYGGEKYYWTEFLLFNAARGFAWLVDSDDHWSFATAVSAGEVSDDSRATPARVVRWHEMDFKLFQTGIAVVEYVLGEFYWRVEAGEQAATADYIRPPEGLSRETTTSGAREVNWSHARYVQPSEIEGAFGVRVPRPAGVGSLQPGPRSIAGRTWVMLAAALIVIGFAVSATRAHRDLFHTSVDPASADWGAATAQEGHVAKTVFSPEFTVSGNQNIEIAAYSPVNNTWAYVGGDLVNEDTGVIESFELPVEYYSGVDGGESWSEGDQKKSIFVSAPPKGRYLARMEVQFEKDSGPPVTINVSEGVFRWTHFLFAFFAITIAGIVAALSARGFEQKRWSDSNVG